MYYNVALTYRVVVTVEADDQSEAQTEAMKSENVDELLHDTMPDVEWVEEGI